MKRQYLYFYPEFYKIQYFNIDKSWDWNSLSYNQDLTIDFVLAHPDKPWNFEKLSCHKMKKGKEKYIKDKAYQFKFISEKNKIFPNIENIIIEYI